MRATSSTLRTETPANQSFAQQLLARQSQLQRLQWYKIGAVWGALFLFLAGLLYLIGVDVRYVLDHAGPVLSQGLGNTLKVSLISILLATILAFGGALGRLASNPIAQGVSGFYISLIRGTPLLVQIYLIYNGLPQIGVQLRELGYPTLGNALILDAVPSGILALSLNYGAYMTEIFRAGIEAISRGQTEAARALGMSHWQAMRLVILPQAFRIVIPPIGNQFIAMQKDSALVSLMGVWEITWLTSKIARQQSKFMEMFLLAAAVYWVLTIISEWLQSRLERSLAQTARR